MTLLFYDGFDGLTGQYSFGDIAGNPMAARYYAPAFYAKTTSSIIPAPLYGGNVLATTSFFGFGYDESDLPAVNVCVAPHTSGVVGFRLLADTVNRKSIPNVNQQPLLEAWYNTYSAVMFAVSYNKQYQISIHTGSVYYNDPMKTSTFKMCAQTWYYVEIGYTLQSAGLSSIVVRVDGEEILSVNDINFGSYLAPYTYAGRMRFFGHPRMAMDDIYILDTVGPAPLNTFLGDVNVISLIPSASGDLTEWTASSGANWATLDDVGLSGSTDYVYTSASAATDLYKFTNLSVTASNIYAVKPIFGYFSGSTYQTPKPSVRSLIVPVLNVSGTLYYGENYTPSPRVIGYSQYESRNKYYKENFTIYQEHSGMYTKNPATLSSWTMGDIASLQSGLTIISSSRAKFQSYIIY